MKKYFPLVFIFFFFVFEISCKKDTETSVDVGYSYFPVNVGHWVMYEVDSTVWDDFYNINDSLHERAYNYKIKEIIESEFYDNEGRLTQRLERYKKLNDTTDWFINDVWTMNLTSATAEKVEENNRFIKLVFPVSKNTTWNGNAFNTIGEAEYEYDDIDVPATINGILYDSTLTVIQASDTNNLIEAQFQYEIFARNIGLIYKRYRYVTFDIVSHEILSGKDYSYKIISYGN